MKRFLAFVTFAAALGFLPSLCARAAVQDNVETKSIKLRSQNQVAVVEGVVVPDSISDRQPFSFAAGQVREGDVVSIQSVSGVVVQHAAGDKLGRVFLAAGLPAGAYLISRSSHDQPIGKIEIHQRAGDALERPWEHPPQPMQLQNAPQAIKLGDPFLLSGHGFSPNYVDMRISLTSSGGMEAPMVLAATEDQLKLAPVQQLQPGEAQLKVTNQATGLSTDYQLLLYDIHGQLTRPAIKSGGDKTQLVITVQPESTTVKVKVSVVSGPVDFGRGRKEAEAVTSKGQATFPVHAEHGSGPFQLTWELIPPERTRNAGSKPTVAQVEAGTR